MVLKFYIELLTQKKGYTFGGGLPGTEKVKN